MAFKNKKDEKKYKKQWIKDNPEKVKKSKRLYYLTHPEYRKKLVEDHKRYQKEQSKRLNEYNKQWARNNPEKVRATQFKSSYGLSYKDWLKLWEVQDGKCAICGKSFDSPSDANVDHNHKTGEIRGLLCKTCNLGLGCFYDNPKLTIKATEYLEEA